MYTSLDQTARDTASKGRAVLVAIGPLALAGALLWHPPLPGRLPDSEAVAHAAAGDITR